MSMMAALLALTTSPIATADTEPLPVALEIPLTSDQDGTEARMFIKMNNPLLHCSFHSTSGYWVHCRQEYVDPTMNTTQVIWTYRNVSSFEYDEAQGVIIVIGSDALFIYSRFRRPIDIALEGSSTSKSPGI